MINKLIFCFIGLTNFMLGCTYNAKSSNNTNKNTEQKKEIVVQVVQQDSTEIGYLDYKLIGTLKKVNQDQERYEEYFEKCTDWVFKEKSIFNLLKKMRKVEATEAYARCYQYPCWYEGKVSNGDADYEIAIYAGAFVTLSNNDETLHFIMEEKSDLFVDFCSCCEDD